MLYCAIGSTIVRTPKPLNSLHSKTFASVIMPIVLADSLVDMFILHSMTGAWQSTVLKKWITKLSSYFIMKKKKVSILSSDDDVGTLGCGESE